MAYAILFEPSATSFTTQGLGALADAVSCEVTEEINGEYELEMQYPVSGIHYSDIHLRSLIVCRPNPADERQAFRVYQISKPLNGIVNIYARHISYDLSGYPVKPFAEYDGARAAALALENNYIYDNLPFEIDTEFDEEGTFAVDVPSSIRSWMGGRTGSMVDVFGGEWKYDNFSCKLVANRGQDRGVTIRYGKNLTSMDWEDNSEDAYTGVLGYYAYIYTKESEQRDAPPRYIASHVTEVIEYYAAGISKTDPPDDSEFVSEAEWKEDESKKVSVTKDKPYLWNYEAITRESGSTGKKSKQLIGHYGWTSIEDTEGQIGDNDVEYDEFGNSLVPYEHTVRTTPTEYYAISDSQTVAPPEQDEDGRNNWRTSVPSFTEEKPYLWNYSVVKREAKKERIIFSDVIPTGTYDYTRILTVDLSDEFESRPTTAQLNSFIRKYIATNKLADNALNITLDFVQLADINETILLGDVITVFFNNEKKKIRCNRVVWDVLKDRYSSIEVGFSQYAGMSDAISRYAAKANSGGKYGSSSLLAYIDNGYIKADTVDTRLLKAEEAIIDTLQSKYATIKHLEAEYASIDYLDANYINTETIVAAYADINKLNAEEATITDLISETAKVHNLTADSLESSVGYIHSLSSNDITAESIIADHGAIATFGSHYAAIDFANVETADITEAWVKDLMIQGRMVARNGTYFDLTGLRINADDIRTGTLTADRLQLKGNDGLYYALNYDALGRVEWDALSPEEQTELQQHLHAKTILAHSITSDQLTVNNIVGTGGWINLAQGTFEYQNAETGDGITWDGQHLYINADSLSIGSRSISEIASESNGLNRLPSVYLYEDFFGKIFTDSGITWTVNQDGSVTAKGTADGVARYFLTSCETEDSVPAMLIDPEKKYTISGCVINGLEAGYIDAEKTSYWIGGRLYREDETPGSTGGTPFIDIGAGCTTQSGYRYITIYAQVADGYTTPEEGITFYPMLEVGETKHPYVSTHDGTYGLAARMGVAEAKIDINADNIALKVSKDSLISEINASAEKISILSSKIDLTGAVTIQDLESAAQNNLVTSVSSRNQYYLSDSANSLSGGQWYDSQGSMTWEAGKYVWVRVATDKTYANGTTRTEYSTGVYDRNLTLALSTASSAAGSASAAAGSAAAAQATADKAIASTVSVYYRSTTNSAPAINTSSSIGTATDTSNAWEYVMPAPKRGCYYYTCERYTLKDGTISFSAVRPMTNLTYTSLWCSSNNATKIDGSSIYTGSITADQIAANTITANKIKAGAITADMITAGTMSADRIKGGTIDCNGRFTFKLPSSIATESDWNIFVLSGTSDSNARLDINPSSCYFNGKNIQNGMIHLENSFGSASAISPLPSGVTRVQGRWERTANYITAKIDVTTSGEVSAVQILSGFPTPYWASGSNWTLPRAVGISNNGNVCSIYINSSGIAVLRAKTADTYYINASYITTD